jgi:uridine kinase
MSAPFFVVVAGGTASGKSTVAGALAPRLGAVLISHDRYYLDVDEPRGHNYDHPDALDTDRLVADLTVLASGRSAGLPVYEFATHSRRPEVEVVQPAPVVVVEGILVLADPRVAKLADLTVYVDCPDDIRLVRRIRRDVVERGRDVNGVLEQYLATVRPMHEQFVAPCRGQADIVLNGTRPPHLLVNVLEKAIRQRL